MKPIKNATEGQVAELHARTFKNHDRVGNVDVSNADVRSALSKRLKDAQDMAGKSVLDERGLENIDLDLDIINKGTEDDAKMLASEGKDGEEEATEPGPSSADKKKSGSTAFNAEEKQQGLLTTWRTKCLENETSAKKQLRESQGMMKEFKYVFDEEEKPEAEQSKDARILLPSLRVLKSRNKALELVLGSNTADLALFQDSIKNREGVYKAPVTNFLDLTTLAALQVMGEDAIKTIVNRPTLDSYKLSYNKQHKATSGLLASVKKSCTDVSKAVEGVSRVRGGGDSAARSAASARSLHDFVCDVGCEIPAFSDPLSQHEKESLNFEAPIIITSCRFMKLAEQNASSSELMKTSMACEAQWMPCKKRIVDKRGSLKVKSDEVCDLITSSVQKLFPDGTLFSNNMDRWDEDSNNRVGWQAILILEFLKHDCSSEFKLRCFCSINVCPLSTIGLGHAVRRQLFAALS
jgi:hypothetical protein